MLSAKEAVQPVPMRLSWSRALGGWGFYSLLGHMHGFRVQSPYRAGMGGSGQCFPLSSRDVSPSQINDHIKKLKH